MQPLNKREQIVFDLLLKKQETGIMPTVREICSEADISSTSVVHKILASLEARGYIKRFSNSSRSIVIENFQNAVNIPILGKVTAGVPILAAEQIEQYFPVPSDFGDRKSLFGLVVSGFSMKNAGILDGDVVIANRDITARSGDIIVALIGDEATVKRLEIENGKPILYPENPDFEPIHPESLEILGKVVGSFRRY